MQGQTNAKIGKKAKLYDTRILETQEAEKGWLYTCSNAYRSFSSSTLPTLYNDINTKLQNSTSGLLHDEYFNIVSSYNYNLTNLNLNDIDSDDMIKLLKCDNKYYTIIINNVYDTSGLCVYNNTWDEIPNIPKMITLTSDNQGTCIVGTDEMSAIYKFNPANNTCIKLLDESSIVSDGSAYNVNITSKTYDNYLYIYIDTQEFASDANNHIYKTPVDPTINSIVDYEFTERVVDILYYNNYWYLLIKDENNVYKIYKGSDLANSNLSDTTKWELIYTINSHIICMYVINNRFMIFCSSKYIYTDDNFTTMNVVNSNIGYKKIMCLNNIIIMIGESSISYCDAIMIDNINNWQTQSVLGEISYISNTIQNKIYIINEQGTSHNPLGVAYELSIDSVYGSFIINYTKYENFKICQYSDLTDLNTLYNRYGISNYWNIYNNQISIPLNKQEYTVMYVGDNFVDDLYE